MKKIMNILFVFIIIILGIALYKSNNNLTISQNKLNIANKEIQNYNFTATNAKSSSPPKIVYKDKIVYKNSPDVDKILYQTDLLLYNMRYKNTNNCYMVEVGGSVGNLTGLWISKGLTNLNTDQILKGITLLNINNPEKEKMLTISN